MTEEERLQLQQEAKQEAEFDTAQSITFEELQKIVDKWLVIKDKSIIKLLCALIISHGFKNDPVWIYLVAPPSSGKTEFLRALMGVASVYSLSNLTPNALLSGMQGKEQSLLINLGSPILIFKDWTNILSQGFEDRLEIMGQLREVYDGHLDKTTGTGGKSWKGRVTLIAGVTPEIDMQSMKMTALGERFVYYRIDEPDRITASRKAIDNAGKSEEMRKELQKGFSAFLKKFLIVKKEDDKLLLGLQDKYKPDALEIPEKIKNEISEIADFVARARASIVRDKNAQRDILFIHPPEMPMRLIKQLITLMTAFYVINDNTFNEDDLNIIFKVAIDSIQINIKSVLMELVKGDAQTTAAIATAIGYPTNTTRMFLEDLTARKLVNRIKADQRSEEEEFFSSNDGSTGNADRWTLKDEYVAILRKYEGWDKAEKTEDIVGDIFD